MYTKYVQIVLSVGVNVFCLHKLFLTTLEDDFYLRFIDLLCNQVVNKWVASRLLYVCLILINKT